MKRYLHIVYIAVAILAMIFMPLFSRGKVFNVVEPEPEELLAEGEYIISPYDDIFRRVCRRHNLDWVLMCAIAHSESRFRADVSSSRGAVGIMQVMPHIARHWDVTAEELLDPAINIDVACRLYKSMQRQLQVPKSVGELDRIAFTIASYNCGASRIIDARNLAEYYDEPKYEWSVVSEYLQLLSSEEFYNHEAVVGGEFKEPHITIAYTNKVLKTYQRFSALPNVRD
jgi:membrane-bound lytic murein transglycosylase F